MRDRSQLGLHPTNLQLAKLRERSNALCRKIQAWIKIQEAYMPCASVLRARAESATSPSSTASVPDLEPEYLKLWLPSTIHQQAACSEKLRLFEWQHRMAQANDALNELRDGLRLRSYLYKYKDQFVRGQKHNTRSRTTIQRVQNKVDSAAQKYRIAYQALQQLSCYVGEEGWDTMLKPLEKDDIKGLSERGYEESEGRRKLSWIWLSLGAELDRDGAEGDKHLHNGGWSCVL
jgi:hypothetical protein